MKRIMLKAFLAKMTTKIHKLNHKAKFKI